MQTTWPVVYCRKATNKAQNVGRMSAFSAIVNLPGFEGEAQ